jgi:hypothetical protein
MGVGVLCPVKADERISTPFRELARHGADEVDRVAAE